MIGCRSGRWVGQVVWLVTVPAVRLGGLLPVPSACLWLPDTKEGWHSLHRATHWGEPLSLSLIFLFNIPFSLSFTKKNINFKSCFLFFLFNIPFSPFTKNKTHELQTMILHNYITFDLTWPLPHHRSPIAQCMGGGQPGRRGHSARLTVALRWRLADALVLTPPLNMEDVCVLGRNGRRYIAIPCRVVLVSWREGEGEREWFLEVVFNCG